MAIDSVSSATATTLALQTPQRPRPDDAPRTAPETANRATNEPADSRRPSDVQGAVPPERTAQPPAAASDAPAATDAPTRPTLNTAGQTVGRIVDTTA